jgi:hypothetical protein
MPSESRAKRFHANDFLAHAGITPERIPFSTPRAPTDKNHASIKINRAI